MKSHWTRRTGLSVALAIGIVGLAATLAPSHAAQPKGVPRQLAAAPPTENSKVKSENPDASPGQLTIFDKAGKRQGICPLQHTDMQAHVSGYVSRVTVTQEFRNPSRTPVEAVYTFPLPEDAAVDDMTMLVGKRVVKSRILKREEARETYEAAKAEGKATALLDQERANIFTQSVANILPGDRVTIKISYVNLLKYEDGAYSFVFPMVVGQRYIAGASSPARTAAQAQPYPTISLGEAVAPGLPTVETWMAQPNPTISTRDAVCVGFVSQPGDAHRTRADDLRMNALLANIQLIHLGDLFRQNQNVTAQQHWQAALDGNLAIVTDGDKIAPPITPEGTRAGHDISLTITLDAGLPLGDVSCLSHPTQISRPGPTQAVVTLANETAIPNKDFVLRYTAAGSEIASGMLTTANAAKTGGANGYFTMIVQPPLSPPRQSVTPKEMIFVIDQTGSQAGKPIAQAKATMRHCIANLNPGDTFQLIGFNTELYSCFPAPVGASPETIATALKFLEPIEGSGGTDILKSVDYALKLPDDPDRLRIICYMTDGYVGNDMQILDCVQKNRGSARMFPFGVGGSVNRFLIDGMAREGRGAAEYVSLDESGEAAAKRFYHRVADPVLLDVSVDWNGLPVEDVFPRHIPDVFSAAPIILKGRYTQSGEGDVTIHGLLRGKPWQQTIHVVFPAQARDGEEIRTLWAREKVADLENRDWMGQQQQKPDATIKEQIVNTALEYRLMSPYTSFVAVEEKVINAGGRQRTLAVPVEMPEGVSYDGIFGESESPAPGSGGRTHFSFGRSLGYAPSGATYYRGLGNGNFGGSGRGLVARMGRTPAIRLQGPVGVPVNGTVSQLSVATKGKAAQGAGLPSQNVLSESLSTLDANNAITLNKLKPADRRTLLRQTKLAAALQILPQTLAKQGRNGSLHKPGLPNVTNGMIEVQIRLNSLPANGLATLKKLGFTLEATVQPGKLLLGTVPVQSLDALTELRWLRFIELPRFQ